MQIEAGGTDGRVDQDQYSLERLTFCQIAVDHVFPPLLFVLGGFRVPIARKIDKPESRVLGLEFVNVDEPGDIKG